MKTNIGIRGIKPIEEGVCPDCGSKGYVQKDSARDDKPYTAWCSNMHCCRFSSLTYHKTLGGAVRAFLEP